MTASSSPSGDGDADLAILEARLGHRFTDTGLLLTALRHVSTRAGIDPANERMEFLGDRILGLIVAEAIYRRWPDDREGAMGKRLAHLVSRVTCAQVARAMGLSTHLRVRLSKAELAAGATDRTPLLADTMEAVIAALYLDGGLDAARRFVLAEWETLLAATDGPPRDPKGRLQEWAMARRLPLPHYQVVGRDGPAHAPRFRAEVSVAGAGSAIGEAGAKQAAEIAAAAALLARIEGPQ